jgi:hypothetical protein
LQGLPEKRLEEMFRKIAMITRGYQLAMIAGAAREEAE